MVFLEELVSLLVTRHKSMEQMLMDQMESVRFASRDLETIKMEKETNESQLQREKS